MDDIKPMLIVTETNEINEQTPLYEVLIKPSKFTQMFFLGRLVGIFY